MKTNKNMLFMVIPFLFNTFSLSAIDLTIPFSNISMSSRIGEPSIVKSIEGFSVVQGKIKRDVHSYDVDSTLRSLNIKQLAQVLQKNRIKAIQLSNGDYKLALVGGLKGGGPIGAWLGGALGFSTVHAATEGVCLLIAAPVYLINPVLGAAVHYGVSNTGHLLVQPIAYTAAIAGGIAAGTATGPV